MELVAMKTRAMALSLALALAGQSARAAAEPFVWPDGAKAAVNLSYDDAIDSQLDNAIPALNKYGLKGTFYLVLSSGTVSRRLSEWRRAAAQGHELGNHTLFHQCSRAVPGHEWVTPDNDLDHVSVAQLAAQIRLGNSMLHAIDGRSERTFAVPCGDLGAAGENYIPAIQSEFVAIRSATGGVTADMWTLDPHAVSAATPSNVSGEQLIAIAKAAASKGTMANFTFHGVGGDYLAVSSEAHEELLKYLAANRRIYWTDTFISIMKYVEEQQRRHGSASGPPR
jgi:peptidoglycan/xylan/chitin deacetylase (PgdA/CDA1 family)